MNHKLSAIGISLLLFLSPTFAFAQTATTGTTARQLKLETRQQNITQKLENIQQNIASREATLKDRLAKFKDKLKAERVQRISDNLNRMNRNRVNTTNKFLANATRLLDKLQERVASGAAKGKDATAANAAITDARLKIASASSAVTAQSSMDYTISISSESAAKAEIKAQRDKFHSDWQNVRKLIIAAKQVVAHAIEVAATTLGGSK